MKAATDAEKSFRVLCIKDTGARVEFSAYASRAEAELVSSKLRAMGCRNEIESPWESSKKQRSAA
jgi:hypothetical protein